MPCGWMAAPSYQHTFESRGRAVGFMRDLLAGRHETCSDIAHAPLCKEAPARAPGYLPTTLGMQRSHCK